MLGTHLNKLKIESGKLKMVIVIFNVLRRLQLNITIANLFTYSLIHLSTDYLLSSNKYLASNTTGIPLTTQNTIANTAAQKPIAQIISL